MSAVPDPVPATLPPPWRAWLRAFWPAPATAGRAEQLRVCIGAALGIGLTALLSHALGAWIHPAVPWLVAPLGASAVLVFGVPASPLAQPWAVLGGNTLSALWAVACVHLFAPPELRMALAVGGAIGLMFALRCLHPPGGASALLVALAGVGEPAFALFPVAFNSLLLVLAGMAYNTATRRSYPHRAPVPSAPTPQNEEARAAEADLDAVLAHYNQVLDISRDDLRALVHDTQMRGHERRLARLVCSDIMSRDPVTVGWRTPLPQAWALLREHRVKALPVVDRSHALVGIITQADFVRAAEDGVAGYEAHRAAVQSLAGGQAVAGQLVGDIMTRRVRVARAHRHLVDLIPLFRGSGHHHLPIVDDQDKLVGMITVADVVAALARAERQLDAETLPANPSP
jgi:CBS domain-containing membrane protein